MPGGGAQAGVVERGAELGGGAADEAGVLDPGVPDLGQLGQALLEVDGELVAQGVELHADPVAGDAVRAAGAGLGGRADQGGRADRGGAGGGGAEKGAAADVGLMHAGCLPVGW